MCTRFFQVGILCLFFTWSLTGQTPQSTSEAEKNDEIAKAKVEIQKRYISFLNSEGIVGQVTTAGQVQFKRDGVICVIEVNVRDRKHLRIFHRTLSKFESGEERLRMLEAAFSTTSSIKVAKVLFSDNEVWVSAESYLTNEEDFKLIFFRCLSALQAGVQKFNSLTKVSDSTPAPDRPEPARNRLESGPQKGQVKQQASTNPSSPAPAKEPSVKVKDLYMGMDIKGVSGVLEKKFPPNTFRIFGPAKDNSGDSGIQVLGALLNGEQNDIYVGIIAGMLPIGGVLAGPDGAVKRILLPTPVVDVLFNSEGLDASDFVRQFADAYKIPSMKISDDLKSWVYSSPEGTKVTISTKKEIVIEKVASAQDLKRSFN